MFQLIKSSFKDFTVNLRKYIIFEGIYKALTSVLFIPLISYIFHFAMRTIGSRSLLNKQIFKIGLNYKGFVGLIVILIISTIFIFIEYGSLIVISQKNFFKKNVSIADAFLTCIAKIPRIFNFGMIKLILLVILIIPFIEAPVTARLIENIAIPKFVMDAIFESNILSILYMAGVCAVIYVFLRWIFTIHFIIIEGKNTKEAIKSSLYLTKNNKSKILFELIIFNIASFLATLLLIICVLLTIGFTGTLFDAKFKHIFTGSFIIMVISAATFISTLVITPMNIIFLTRIYYELKENRGEKIYDSLSIVQNGQLNRFESSIATFLKGKKGIVISIIILAVIGFGMVNNFITDEVMYLGRDINIAGHRGSITDAPENSLPAIMNALEKGANFVEIDVQQTKDGVVVLHHDKTLKKIAGISDNITDLTYKDLASIDIGCRFSNRYAGEKIPTLEEILVATKDKINLIIELKSYNNTGNELAKKVVDLVEKHDMIKNCYIQSLDYKALQTVRKLNKDIKIGQIIILSAGDLSTLDLDFYTIEQTMLSDAFVKKANRLNREVWVWTVNEEEDIRNVLLYNIDGIITDYPERIKDIVTINNKKQI
ncbi:MAG: glycerophosphodiester phosphodiesterase [Xylanivirga thermophila]|jgi:glycerophosphoryl diester phosphodiesterase|uniref:glycerophosphodiester phosphodiesterase n=1 Tax=Xylanivirga thermophila TaxID=2496273 RepID=UPI00101D5206|nr:glycerophosphodiester phosphodiesterase [Xylanivirga thermophila]